MIDWFTGCSKIKNKIKTCYVNNNIMNFWWKLKVDNHSKWIACVW